MSYDEEVDGLSVVGDDDIAEGIGALVAKALAKAPRVQPHNAMRIKRPHWMGPEGTPTGISLPREEMDYLPFSQVTLTDASPTGQMIAFPQRPFRGERVIASAILQTPTSASDGSFLAAINPAIYVGAVQVGASQGPTPFNVFQANAFGVRLSFPHAAQGTRMFVPVNTLATLGPGNSLILTLTVIGAAVR